MSSTKGKEHALDLTPADAMDVDPESPSSADEELAEVDKQVRSVLSIDQDCLLIDVF